MDLDNSFTALFSSEWLRSAWEMRDKRVDGVPLMNSFLPTLSSVIVYFLVALKLGPMCMKNRKPLNLRNEMMIYNIIMVVLNGYMHYQCWALGWGTDYSWRCQPIDRALIPRNFESIRVCWLFFICKFLDWFDTLFFILRKKFEHISVLHLYHHTIMPCVAWVVVRYTPTGHATFGGLLNTGVHVIMHFYYCVAALGPKYQKYLWWKKLVTILQLAQFVVGILHKIQAMFIYECDIGIPNEWRFFFLAQAVIVLLLFVNFYIKAYLKRSVRAVEKSN